jgi:hypothetical protein
MAKNYQPGTTTAFTRLTQLGATPRLSSRISTPGAFPLQSSELLQQRHEVDLQQRRLERQSEDLRLERLKARLEAKVYEQQQPELIARAS